MRIRETVYLVVARAGRKVAVFLTEDLITQLEMLEDSSASISAKRDYRFAHEPKGEEQQAWLKALEILMGGNRFSLPSPLLGC